MLRAIAGVVLGYLTMAVLVFVLFTAAYLAMGVDGAFRPGSYDVSDAWIAMSVVVSLGAAIAGGFVCAAVSRLPKPPLVLALLALVLGVLSAIPHLTAEAGEPKERTGDVSNVDAMMAAKQPVWIALANPILGAAGVLVGARLKRRSS
jgi:hypothetical protein